MKNKNPVTLDPIKAYNDYLNDKLKANSFPLKPIVQLLKDSRFDPLREITYYGGERWLLYWVLKDAFVPADVPSQWSIIGKVVLAARVAKVLLADSRMKITVNEFDSIYYFFKTNGVFDKKGLLTSIIVNDAMSYEFIDLFAQKNFSPPSNNLLGSKYHDFITGILNHVFNVSEIAIIENRIETLKLGEEVVFNCSTFIKCELLITHKSDKLFSLNKAKFYKEFLLEVQSFAHLTQNLQLVRAKI